MLDAIIESPEHNTELQSAVQDVMQVSGDEPSTFQRLAAEEPAAVRIYSEPRESAGVEGCSG